MSRPLSCCSFRCPGEHPVNPYSLNSFCRTNRVGKRGRIDDRLRIEENQIGVVAFANHAPLGQSESLCWHHSHPANRLGCREELFFTAVSSQNPGKGSP